MKSDEIISLTIDAFTPQSLPMSRLSEYLKPFAAMLGSESSVHFDEVGSGSAILRARVDSADTPKVHDRIHAVATKTGSKSALKAYEEIDDLLAKDNAVGDISIGQQKVIAFPGRLRAVHEVIGPVTRSTSVEGQIYSIGGKDETINVYLQNGDEEIRCVVSVPLAQQLGPHLRGRKARLFGSGSYLRVDGKWLRKSFAATDFVLLDDSSLPTALNSIREVFRGVDADSFLTAMEELRQE